MRLSVFAAISLLALGAASPALAWGDTGHRIIGSLAIESLPGTLPAFLRTPEAAADVGEWAREPDRWRGAGRVHDDMRDPGHFVDVDDDGRILGGPKLSNLPATRTDYDTALRAAGATVAKAGFLPYSIVDGYQQVVKDFGFWRADTYAAGHESDPDKKAWILRDLARRRAQALMDIGIWGHYVGDGSQPLHASTHYNGWGNGPNPQGFTQEHIHVPWEGPFVRDHVTRNMVQAEMTPLKAPADIMAETERYLGATHDEVAPLYTLITHGGLKPDNAALIRFTVARVAAGASELRDLIATAWQASDKATIGYPAVSVADIEAGKVKDVYALLYGEN